jgi:hypothetical protein
MNCPNNCSALPEMIRADITPEVYAEILRDNVEERDGVSSIEILETGPELTLRIEVNQDAYKTRNHFSYRSSYEYEDAFGIVDQEDGVVHLIYTGRPITRANRCSSCGTVYHPEIDESNISELPSKNMSFDWSLPV